MCAALTRLLYTALHLVSDGAVWYWRTGMDYPVVASYFLFSVFALGACLGSFLNVCIWRLPLGESVVDAPSHCTTCGYDIRWYDNLPIISYIVLRGRCRNCHTHYSCRYLLVELLTGLLFVAYYIKTGRMEFPAGMLMAGFVMILLAITTAWIDIKHRIIPDATTYPAMILALAAAGLFPGAWGTTNRLLAIGGALTSGLVWGVILYGLALAGRLIFRCDALGMGDVKFMIACAMLLGVPGTFFVLLTGSMLGTFFGIGYALVRRKPLKRVTIAFGPFLAASAVVWLFAGEWLLQIYLQGKLAQ